MSPPTRPRVSAFVATSLDGFLARPDGGLDWLEAVHAEGEDHGYGAFFASVDTLLVGRGTYDAVLGFDAWPWEGKRVRVLTRRALAPRHDEAAVEGPLPALLAHLAEQGARHVYADGGQVISQLLGAGLLDALTVSIVPVVLGAGLRLFPGGEPERRLALEGSQAYPSGLVQLRYRVG